MNSSETLHKYAGPAVVVASEAVATGMAAKSYIEGNPLSVHELVAWYGLMTFYIGIPAGIAATGLLQMFKHNRRDETQIPRSPGFPQTPIVK